VSSDVDSELLTCPTSSSSFPSSSVRSRPTLTNTPPTGPTPTLTAPPDAGGRSARLTNPLAWERGLVFCQCQHCGVWHTLAANNPNLMEEIRYDDPEGQKRRRDALFAEARAAETAAAGGGGDSDDDSMGSAGTVVGGVEANGDDGATSRR